MPFQLRQPKPQPTPRTDTRWHMARQRQRGAHAVEMALVAPIFFLLFMSVAEFGAMMWVNLTMQHAVREGARYAITGQSGLDASQSPQRYTAVLNKIRQSAMGTFDLAGAQVVTKVNGTSASSGSSMFGGPGDIVIIQINCAWPLFTPMVAAFYSQTQGRYKFTVAATMRNEAY